MYKQIRIEISCHRIIKYNNSDIVLLRQIVVEGGHVAGVVLVALRLVLRLGGVWRRAC